jgi:hypothetical protein
MSRCSFCRGDGLYFAAHGNPDGYVVLACTCPAGARWRVKHQLKAFAARLDPPPLKIGRLEEFFTPHELQALTTVTREHTVKNGREQVYEVSKL